MSRFRSIWFFLVALAVAPAHAAMLTYSNTMTGANFVDAYPAIRSLWESMLSTQYTVTFEESVLTGTLFGIFTYDTTVGCTSYSACVSNFPPPPGNPSTAQFRTVFSGQNRSHITTGSPVPGKFFGSFGGGYVQVDLPTPPVAATTAFAAHLWTTSSPGGNITVQVFAPGGSTPVATYTLPTNANSTPAFFGLTSNTPVGFVRFVSSQWVALDQFDFGALASAGGSSELPESTTLSYVSLGAVALLFGAVCKRRSA
ncbi:MAG: hypothetical protein NZV14_06135 [Bryobacteraceae bacterium]|nr:hypothetical protein [Bryobacteraceae bacterium]MDW8377720.1 hypothetical protein [Bryobacterales bacterium]